jgi:heme A synthase
LRWLGSLRIFNAQGLVVSRRWQRAQKRDLRWRIPASVGYIISAIWLGLFLISIAGKALDNGGKLLTRFANARKNFFFYRLDHIVEFEYQFIVTGVHIHAAIVKYLKVIVNVFNVMRRIIRFSLKQVIDFTDL